jgi:hypothetical protein
MAHRVWLDPTKKILWQTSEGNHAGIRCLFNRIKIMEKQSASRAGAAVGAMIFSVFGSGWLLAWAIRSFAQAAVMWALIVGLGLALFITAFRQYRRNREAHAAVVETPESKKGSAFLISSILVRALPFFWRRILRRISATLNGLYLPSFLLSVRILSRWPKCFTAGDIR